MKHEFNGHLTVYFETGMECLSLILQDNRGIYPNSNYDPKKNGYPYDVPFWHSLAYSVFFRGGEEIEIYRKDGSIEFKGVITKDRKLMAAKGYRYQFLPKEVPCETWISWFAEERKARVWSDEAPIGEGKS